jgi:hypothetical protein
VHLKLVQCGSKLPADLSNVRLAHSQAKPDGSGRRRPAPAASPRSARVSNLGTLLVLCF